MNGLSTWLLLLLLTGCMKSTRVVHQWPDGSATTVRDWRVNMQTEAGFEFVQDTNGVKIIRAGVRSGADAEAAYQMIGAGLKILGAAR